jgi:hypothetical protein
MNQNEDGFESKFILSKLFGMINTEQDMRKAVAECTVAKIHGQPTNQDINHLDDELTAIASSFPSKLG